VNDIDDPRRICALQQASRWEAPASTAAHVPGSWLAAIAPFLEGLRGAVSDSSGPRRTPLLSPPRGARVRLLLRAIAAPGS